jgi:hypothetical protein
MRIMEGKCTNGAENVGCSKNKVSELAHLRIEDEWQQDGNCIHMTYKCSAKKHRVEVQRVIGILQQLKRQVLYFSAS